MTALLPALRRRRPVPPGTAPSPGGNVNDDGIKTRTQATHGIFQWRVALNGPQTYADRLVNDVVCLIGFGLAVLIFFGALLPVFQQLDIWVTRCPTFRGVECNGKGVCQFGNCVSFDPRYSGRALNVSACPAYDRQTDGVCGGRGVCSPFMRFEDVPEPCRWVTPSPENNFNPANQRGWDHPECLRFLREQRALHAQGVFSNASAGVPTCLCFGSADGDRCQYNACPTALNNKVCSGRGLPTAHLFTNTSLPPAGDGCQCTNPFSFLDSAVLLGLSDTQRFNLRRQVDLFQQPFCGQLVRAGESIFVVKSVVGEFSASNFKCLCQDNYFGEGCQFGKCPENEFGQVCNGQGHPAFGFEAAEAVRECHTVCASPAAQRCPRDPDRCVFPEPGRATRDQLCNAARTCPAEARYRCPDGSCTAGENTDSAGDNPEARESACAAGFTTAVLDGAWFDARRAEARCLGTDPTCIPPVLWNGTQAVVPAVSAAGSTVITLTASPLAWFYLSVSSAAAENAQVQISIGSGGGQVMDFAVAPGAPQALLGHVHMAQTELFDFVSDGAVVTAVDEDEFVVPFFNAVPTRWDEIRLERDGGGEYLRALALDVRTEFAPSVVLPRIVLDNAPFGLLGISGTTLSEAVCLADTDRCAWTYNSPTSVTALGGGGTVWACWNGLRWATSTALCNANATLAPTRPVRSVLRVFPLVTRFIAPDSVWNVQFKAKPFRFPTFNLTIASPVDLVVHEMELLTYADLRVPCACAPATIARNQSETNIRIGRDPERARGLFSAGQHVVVPVVQFGHMRFERGFVVASTPNSTVVAARALNDVPAEFPTRLLRFMTADEFTRGLDDCDPDVFPTRCSTGTCARTNSSLIEHTLKCNCTAAADSGATTCTCEDGVACTCIAGADRCDCPATVLEFERRLAALLNDMDANCSCFSIDSPISQNATFYETTLWTGDGVGLDSTNGTLLSLRVPVCALGMQVFGRNLQLAAQAPPQALPVVLNCFNSTLMEVRWTSLQRWTRLEWTGLPPGTPVLAQWFSHAYVRVDDFDGAVVYTASSNAPSAGNAQGFTWGVYWASVLAFVENPAWVRIDFSAPSIVAGVLLTLRRAALTSDIPVEVLVQGLGAEDGVWRNLGFVISSDFDTEPAEAQRRWVASLMPTLPLRAVRLLSRFPLAVYEFVPLTTQGCTCATSSLMYSAFSPARPAVTLLPSAPVLDTVSLYKRLLPRYLASNGTGPTESCVCADACIINTPGGQYADVSNNGVCNDELAFVLNNNVSVSTVTLEGPIETSTPFSVMQSAFPPEDLVLLGANATNCFLQVFDNTLPRVVMHWCGATPAPDETDALAVSTLFGVWNLTGAANYSGAYAFTFLSPTDNATTLNGNGWVLLDAGAQQYTRQVNITLARYGDALALQLVCPTGYDCTDCGDSERLVAEAPFTNCQPLTALERAFMDDIANQSSLAFGEWRAVSEFQRQVAVFGLPVTSMRPAWFPVCPSKQVCPFPEHTPCSDGVCRRECSETRECDRTGCVTSDVNSDVYACACRQGWGGLQCEYNAVVPPQPFAAAGTVDPNQVIHFTPPLREQPPSVGLNPLLSVTNEDLLRRNRAWKPRQQDTFLEFDEVTGLTKTIINSSDVENLRIKARHAPYGSVIERVVQLQSGRGDFIRTSCPPAHRGPLGQILLLEQDVRVRDPVTGKVLEWTEYDTPEGGKVQYIWKHEFWYDELPFPCDNGHCVETAADCAASKALFPVCNNHGRALPDGTCECAPGFVTFLYTDRFSAKTSIPYAYDDAQGHTVPYTWNSEPNFNWRDFGSKWCAARDCTVLDCSVPYGCPPGTPENGFRDKWIRCSAVALSPANTNPASGVRGALGRPNTCARTAQDCLTGTNLIPTLPCSGKGIPRRRDYRDPPEYYCACGDPISRSADLSDVEQIVELRKNGYGGPRCDQYPCDEGRSSLHFSRFNPDTGKPYTDLGVPLPGVWKGFCGAPIGPDPLEIEEWKACCTESRLDRCTNIPCRVANVLSCRAPQACVRAGGVPLVYPCNNHGEARKDGTCACTRNEEQGTGYTANRELFDHDNCFKPIECERSQRNGAPCRSVDACTDPGEWFKPPNDRSFDDQLDVYMGRIGNDISNRSLVRSGTNVVEVEKLLENALTRVALQVLAAQRGFNACITVFPGDTPENPRGMAAYTPTQAPFVLPYAKAYASPYELKVFTYAPVTTYAANTYNTAQGQRTDAQLRAVWNDESVRETDEVFWAIPPGQFVNMTFDSPKTFSVVRVFGKALRTGLVLRFLGADGVSTVCSQFLLFDATQVNTWRWFNIYCTPVYRDFPFAILFPADFARNCGQDPVSDTCLTWEEEQCVSPNIWREAGSLEEFRGCASQCCTPTESFSTSPSSVLAMYVSDVFLVDEVRVMGYANATTEMPDMLKYEFLRVAGDGDQAGCAAHPDQRFAQQTLGSDKRYYMPGQFNPATQPLGTAQAQGFAAPLVKGTWANRAAWCKNTGGWLAATRQAILEPPELEPFVYEGAVKNRTDGMKSEDARTFVALRNVMEPRAATPSLDRYIWEQCIQHGCVHFFRSDMFGPTPVYAARNVAQYKSAWWSFQLPWTNLLDPVGVNGPMSTPQVLSTGLAPRCRVRFYERADGTQVWIRHPRWHSCCACIRPGVDGCISQRLAGQNFFGLELDPLLDLFNDIKTACNLYIADADSYNIDGYYNKAPWNEAETRAICYGGRWSFQTDVDVIVPNNPGPSNVGRFALDLFAETSWMPTRPPSRLVDIEVLPPSLRMNAVLPRSMRVLSGTQNCAMVFCRTPPCTGNSPNRLLVEYAAPPPEQLVTLNKFPIVTVVPAPSNPFTGAVQTITSFDAFTSLYLYPVNTYTTARVFVNTEAREATTPGVGSFPGISVSQISRTMGWRDEPFMCMQVQYQELTRFEPFGPYLGINTAVVPVLDLFNTPSNTRPSILLNPFGNTKEIYPCDLLNNLVPQCSACETNAPAKWRWDTRVYPTSGTEFPDLHASGTMPTSLPILIHGFDPSAPEALYPGRPLVRLRDLGSAYANRRTFAWLSCNLDVAAYRQLAGAGPGKPGWTHAHCGSLSSKSRSNVVGSTAGLLEPLPCESPAFGVCMHDFTQYISLPGRRGDYCGYASRPGGFARPGVTCYDAYPGANRTNNEFGFQVLDSYLAGTLNLLISTTQYDYDQAREFLSNFTGLFWAMPGARALFDMDYSDLPLLASPGVRENPYSGINWAITRIWPVDCGWRVSKETGVASRRCAAAEEYCDPDAPQRAPIQLTPENLPTILRPVPLEVDARFEPTCATAARPATYVVRDRYGGPTSFDSQFQVIEADPLFLKVRALRSTFSVFNTGKNPHYYTFQANVTSTVSGEVALLCPTCTGLTTFRVWIAPLDPNYGYPAAPLVLGTFDVQGSAVEARATYSFDVLFGATPNATYQVVGWDVQNARPDAVVRIGNGLITDARTVAACREFRGRLPKFGPKSSIDTGAPDNTCLMTEEDVEFYGGEGELGTCRCDVPDTGAACDAPAITTRFGKFALGGWGELGRVVTPAGTVQSVRTSAAELGVYGYTQPGSGDVVFTGKCRDVGRILRTRLQRQPAYDYLKIFVLKNTFDSAQFLEVVDDVTPFMTRAEAVDIAFGSSAVLPSWVSATEFTSYLALATNATLPLFVDLVRHNLTEDGNADLVWNTRGISFRRCTEPELCAGAPAPVTLPSPVDCGLAAWNTGSPNYCDVINFNNKLYTVPLGVGTLTDGSFLSAPTPSPFSFPTIAPVATPTPFTLYVWFSTLGASATVTTGGCSCTGATVTQVEAATYLQVISCAPGIGVATCAVTTAPTTPGIYEVQQFELGDNVRSAFYPY